MLNVDHDKDGRVDAVRVCSWPSSQGLAAWRTDIAGRVGDGFSFSMWFEDQPVSLSTVVLAPDRAPVTMKALPTMRMQIQDSSGFERFVPHWRWLFTRLGIVSFGTSPLRGFGRGIAEDFDPWIGMFSESVEELIEKARPLDERLERVRTLARSKSDPSLGSDPGLGSEVDGFLEDMIWLGAYFNDPTTNADVFEDEGRLRLELMRPMGPPGETPFVSAMGPTRTHVSDWEGGALVDLIRWLNDPSRLQWRVLEPDAWGEWFHRNSVPGELALPDEEVEVLALLGEDLPFVWKNERLSTWAADRWSTLRRSS